jgi:hypothetical protein
MAYGDSLATDWQGLVANTENTLGNLPVVHKVKNEECRRLGCYVVWLFFTGVKWRNIPEDDIIHSRLLEDLKYYKASNTHTIGFYYLNTKERAILKSMVSYKLFSLPF